MKTFKKNDNMKNCILLTLLILTNSVYSQIWKPVKNKIQAEYLIYETNDKSEADIIAYEVDSELGCTRPGMIYLAPINYSRGKKVSFVLDKNDADLIIYWTKNKNEVKWNIRK